MKDKNDEKDLEIFVDSQCQADQDTVSGCGIRTVSTLKWNEWLRACGALHRILE